MSQSEDSSEPDEFTGSPLVVKNSLKFLSGERAFDRNEEIQRCSDLPKDALNMRCFRLRSVATFYFKTVDEKAVLDYGHQGAGMGRR